jgi:hypothetical protein
MTHVHGQTLARDRFTIVEECEMIEIGMTEIVRVGV